MSVAATARAYAELARLSNAPTCVTNVLTGCAIGSFGIARDGAAFPWVDAVVLSIAIVLLYTAGMALNDLADIAIDRIERPSRPIPSRRISRAGALAFAITCIAVGLALITPFGQPALMFAALLVACIIAYNLLHARFGASVIVMGACRALIYTIAASAIAWPVNQTILITLAGTLMVYVILLSLAARRETSPLFPWERAGVRGVLSHLTPVRLLAIAIPLFAILPGLVVSSRAWLFPLLTGAALLAWLAFTARHMLAPTPRIGRAVLGWIAGLCLLDAYFLALLDQPIAALLAVGCFLLTLAAHRIILGT